MRLAGGVDDEEKIFKNLLVLVPERRARSQGRGSPAHT
jgi:hypothetical protein